jgi:hypothetical protein
MLARRLTTILPALSLAEAIETTRINSVAGLTGARTALVTIRPFQAPHHTISDVGLIGGGHIPMPGEVSIRAHPTHSGRSRLSLQASGPDVLGCTSGTCLLTPRSSPRKLAPYFHPFAAHTICSCCWHLQESASMPYARTDLSSRPAVVPCLPVPLWFLARPRRLARF